MYLNGLDWSSKGILEGEVIMRRRGTESEEKEKVYLSALVEVYLLRSEY